MSTIDVGMDVHWTRQRVYGGSIHITVHDGTVTRLAEGIATIRTKKGGYQKIPVWALRQKGEPSYLDDLLREQPEVTP